MYEFLISSMRSSCPTDLILLDLVVKLPLMQFPQVSFTSSFLGWILFLLSLNLSSKNERISSHIYFFVIPPWYGMVITLLTLKTPVVTIFTGYFDNNYLCILSTECMYGFRIILGINSNYLSKQHYQLIFGIETRRIFDEVRTEFLNIILMNFSFKELNTK
jgi:hypothetical protein